MEDTAVKLLELLKTSMTARISMSPGVWASWDQGEGKWEVYILERRRTKLYKTCNTVEEMIVALKEAVDE